MDSVWVYDCTEIGNDYVVCFGDVIFTAKGQKCHTPVFALWDDICAKFCISTI